MAKKQRYSVAGTRHKKNWSLDRGENRFHSADLENSRYAAAWEYEYRIASFFILAVAGSFTYVALVSVFLLTSDIFSTINLGFNENQALFVWLLIFSTWLTSTVLTGVYGTLWVPLFDGV